MIIEFKERGVGNPGQVVSSYREAHELLIFADNCCWLVEYGVDFKSVLLAEYFDTQFVTYTDPQLIIDTKSIDEK